MGRFFVLREGRKTVKRIAIAVVLLAAIFVASTAKAQVVDGPLDHFACYTVRPLKGTPRFEPIPGVTLRDQFERVTFEVRRPLDICNPARKNDEPVSDAETHLKAYQVKPVRNSEKPIERESLVKDQFHRSGLRVITKRAQILLVPTSKNLGDVVPPPLDPATHAVDHFACYRAKPPKGEKFEKITGVKVEDQFLQSKRYDLLPRWLCNPADKLWLGKVELKKMPQKHLLCYVARRVKGEPKHISRRVAVNNQFGPELLNTIREDMLCIPATKELIDPTPYCGDGAVNQLWEQCDPPDDAWCPGLCLLDCTCPLPPTPTLTPTPTPTEVPTPTPTAEPTPFCGDGAVNQPSEACDPPDPFDANCDTVICTADCKLLTRTPSCGDKCVDTNIGEQCDPPGSLCADGVVCDDHCHCQRYTQYPHAIDSAPASIMVSIFSADDSGCVGTPVSTAQTTGQVMIKRGDPRNPGDGHWVIDTEIVAMTLSGGGVGIFEAPGGSNPFDPNNPPCMPGVTMPAGCSPGQVRQQSPGIDFPIESFFDITYRIDFSGCSGIGTSRGTSNPNVTPPNPIFHGSTHNFSGVCTPLLYNGVPGYHAAFSFFDIF